MAKYNALHSEAINSLEPWFTESDNGFFAEIGLLHICEIDSELIFTVDSETIIIQRNPYSKDAIHLIKTPYEIIVKYIAANSIIWELSLASQADMRLFKRLYRDSFFSEYVPLSKYFTHTIKRLFNKPKDIENVVEKIYGFLTQKKLLPDDVQCRINAGALLLIEIESATKLPWKCYMRVMDVVELVLRELSRLGFDSIKIKHRLCYCEPEFYKSLCAPKNLINFNRGLESNVELKNIAIGRYLSLNHHLNDLTILNENSFQDNIFFIIKLVTNELVQNLLGQFQVDSFNTLKQLRNDTNDSDYSNLIVGIDIGGEILFDDNDEALISCELYVGSQDSSANKIYLSKRYIGVSYGGKLNPNDICSLNSSIEDYTNFCLQLQNHRHNFLMVGIKGSLPLLSSKKYFVNTLSSKIPIYELAHQISAIEIRAIIERDTHDLFQLYIDNELENAINEHLFRMSLLADNFTALRVILSLIKCAQPNSLAIGLSTSFKVSADFSYAAIIDSVALSVSPNGTIMRLVPHFEDYQWFYSNISAEYMLKIIDKQKSSDLSIIQQLRTTLQLNMNCNTNQNRLIDLIHSEFKFTSLESAQQHSELLSGRYDFARLVLNPETRKFWLVNLWFKNEIGSLKELPDDIINQGNRLLNKYL